MAEEMVITVASKTPKEKGGFEITDSAGGKYIVSAKNALVAEGLEPKRASKVSVASTSYGKFINSAEFFDGKPPEEKRIEPITAGVEKPQVAPQAVGMMTKEIGDHIRAGTLSTVFGAKIANDLLVWYRSQTLGITQINFDGKDLPKFK